MALLLFLICDFSSWQVTTRSQIKNKSEADAVVGDSVLREVVGADLLAAIAATHHVAALGGLLGLLLLALDLIEARA